MKILEHAHMLIGTILLIVCLYFYAGSLHLFKQSLLIDSFEGKIGVDTVDYGASSGSSMLASASMKFSRCGRQSLQLDYVLKPSGYAYCAKGYGLYHATDSSTWATGGAGWLIDPSKITWSKFGALSVNIRAGQDGKVAIDLKDSGGELWRHLAEVNAGAWQTLVIPFKLFSPRADWQPPGAVKNRMMDFPLTSFQFEPKTPGSGVLYIDCVKLKE